MVHGLAVGMDLPWSGPYGICDGHLSDRTLAFLERYGHRFVSAFVSWQPPDRSTPSIEPALAAWQRFFEAVPHAARCLHSTTLNLAGADYDRTAAIDQINAFIDHFGFEWVNEDFGHWSIDGWPLPYPQAAPFTDASIAWSAHICQSVDRALHAPLVVEFPGYEHDPGGLDAYDGFRQVVERSGTACNLDTGHLLTWRWVRGHRGEALLDGLDRLPLDRTVELHCAGVVHRDDQLVDAHHGVLADIQLELVDRLMARCPNLLRVTYEDPRFDTAGRLPPPAEASLHALEQRVAQWSPSGHWPPPTATLAPVAEPEDWGDPMRAAFLEPSATGKRLRAQVLTRQHRGTGRMGDRYDFGPDPDEVLQRFFASDEGRGWSDVAWAVPGRCLEDALGRFLAPDSDDHRLACAHVLAVHPTPPFTVPTGFHRAPRGWWAIGGTEAEPRLFAALDRSVRTGPIPPLVVRLLSGERPAGSGPAVERLVSMGLI